MEGKIGLYIFPSDRLQKLRPVLVLREFPKYGDLLVCAISSQTHQQSALNFLLTTTDPNFKTTGLKFDSVFRLDMIDIVDRTDIRNFIGKVDNRFKNMLLQTLADYLTENLP